jgi:hypothetical protein
MGDRGNIIVKEGDSKVYLYSHWTGSDLPEVARSALKRGSDRWSDGQYLARVIFCEMIRGDLTGTTGFGISSTIGDGGETVIVDCDERTVQVLGGPTIPISNYVVNRASQPA